MDLVNQQDNPISAWITASAIAVFSIFSYAWITLSVHQVIPGEPIALVFPPTWTKSDVFRAGAKLDADIMGLGNFNFVLVVMPRTSSSLADLRKNGSLFAMNADFRLICAPTSK